MTVDKGKKRRKYTQPEKYLEHSIISLYSKPEVVKYFKKSGKINELEFGDFQYLLCNIKPVKGDYEDRWKKVLTKREEALPKGRTGWEVYRSKDQLGQELRKLVDMGLLLKTKKAHYAINTIYYPHADPKYDTKQMRKYTFTETWRDHCSLTSFYGLNLEGILKKDDKIFNKKLSGLVEKSYELAQDIRKIKMEIYNCKIAKSLATILVAVRKEKLTGKESLLLNLLLVSVLLPEYLPDGTRVLVTRRGLLGRVKEKSTGVFTIKGEMKEHILGKLPETLRSGVMSDEKKHAYMDEMEKKMMEKRRGLQDPYEKLQKGLVKNLKELHPKLASVTSDEIKKIKKAREELWKEGMAIFYF